MAFLQIGRDFFKDQIEQFGFTEGQGFVIVEELRSSNPASAMARPQMVKEYYLVF